MPENRPEGGSRIDHFLAIAAVPVPGPVRIDDSSYRERVIADIQLDGAVLSVTIPGKRLFSVTTYIFIMWMVGTSLVLFAVASIFMRNQVRPIQRLAEAADQFGKGRELDDDFRPEGALEVRRAAAAFNVMRQRISARFASAPTCCRASATICARRSRA